MYRSGHFHIYPKMYANWTLFLYRFLKNYSIRETCIFIFSQGLSPLWVIAIVGICRYCTLMFLVLIEFCSTLGSLYREARSILLLLSEKRLVLCFLNMSFFFFARSRFDSEVENIVFRSVCRWTASYFIKFEPAQLCTYSQPKAISFKQYNVLMKRYVDEISQASMIGVGLLFCREHEQLSLTTCTWVFIFGSHAAVTRYCAAHMHGIYRDYLTFKVWSL